MSLLDKWLQKVGVQKVEELSPEEKTVYDHYRHILSGDSVSVESIKAFCKAQIAIIEEKFANNTVIMSDHYLKACLHVYLNLLKAIEAPEQERISLELHLTQLLNDPNETR